MTDQTAENLRDISPQMTTSKLHFHAQAGLVDLIDDEPIDRLPIYRHHKAAGRANSQKAAKLVQFIGGSGLIITWQALHTLPSSSARISNPFFV
ncbi:MAG: hypothetical protein ABJE63_03190 [Lentilitoribacter sp.]